MAGYKKPGRKESELIAAFTVGFGRVSGTFGDVFDFDSRV